MVYLSYVPSLLCVVGSVSFFVVLPSCFFFVWCFVSVILFFPAPFPSSVSCLFLFSSLSLLVSLFSLSLSICLSSLRPQQWNTITENTLRIGADLGSGVRRLEACFWSRWGMWMVVSDYAAQVLIVVASLNGTDLWGYCLDSSLGLCWIDFLRTGGAD